jgi:hypothetical protein
MWSCLEYNCDCCSTSCTIHLKLERVCGGNSISPPREKIYYRTHFDYRVKQRDLYDSYNIRELSYMLLLYSRESMEEVAHILYAAVSCSFLWLIQIYHWKIGQRDSFEWQWVRAAVPYKHSKSSREYICSVSLGKLISVIYTSKMCVSNLKWNFCDS